MTKILAKVVINYEVMDDKNENLRPVSHFFAMSGHSSLTTIFSQGGVLYAPLLLALSRHSCTLE
jgi:hypothetical protein